MKKKLNDIQYFSKDKMYSVTQDAVKNHPKAICSLLFLMSSLLLLISAVAFTRSFNFNKTVEKAEYSINGKSDYTVYLKDNDYYETDYLNSGMQYVASLINTVNTNFNYEVHANKDLDFKYTYKVQATLNVHDRDRADKVLYSKVYDLTEEKSLDVSSNNLVINEAVDIDYDKYNSYVNQYSSEYGLLTDSSLEVSLVVNIIGNYDHTEQSIATGKVMTVNIPLSEQTLDINIHNSQINESNKLFDSSSYAVTNIGLFLLSAVALVATVILLVISTRLTKKYVQDNIYTITLDKILKEYDRIIVNGSFSIDESKFSNKIYVDNFTELVDASQSFNEPILFYNVIPGEKCFFVIIKGETLYKMRLTKAYLENELRDKNSNAVVEKETTGKEVVDEEVKTTKKSKKKSE